MAKQQRKVHVLRSLDDDGSKPMERNMAGTAHERGVRKVPSLLFDIELEDTVAEELLEEECGDMVSQILALTKPMIPLEKQLAERVHRIHRDVVAEGSDKVEATLLAKKLHFPGYIFKIRTALGGSCAGSCLRQLRHFFLTCSSKEDPSTVLCVIDPLFKEQFEIANASPRYAKLLAALPVAVVLAEERLASLVNLLSSEMKQSFQASGTTLPPWRQSASMMSKWRPRHSEDRDPGQSPRGERRQSEKKAGKITVPILETFGARQERSNQRDRENRGHYVRPVVRTGFASSPPRESTPSSSVKRSRDMGPPSAYSSLLATKLRGVTAYAAPQFRSQA